MGEINFLLSVIIVFLGSLALASSMTSNDFILSQLTNIALSENFVNVEYSNLSSLVFSSQSFMKWQGPSEISTKNTVVYVSLERSGYIKNKVDNGVWLWLLKSSKEAEKSLNFLIENDEGTIYGVENSFTGVGIKINELSLVSIVNKGSKNPTPIEKEDFSDFKHSMQQKYKYYNCELPSDQRLNLRITLLNGYIYLEHFKGSVNTPTNFKLCFLSEFNFDHTERDGVSLVLSGGLKEENVIYTFDNLSMASIKDINYKDESKEDQSGYPEKEKTEELSRILQSKLEIIEDLGKEAYDKTQNFNRILESVRNMDKYLNDLTLMEKTKFDFEIINDVLNHKNDSNNEMKNSNKSRSNSNFTKFYTQEDFNKSLYNLVDQIKTLTFDKVSFLKGDPRENLVTSIDDLKNRQSSMNISIVEMYESTLTAIEDIKTKAEKLEVYQLFQQFLFVLIFINALILFAMYKNIKEKEERSKNKTAKFTKNQLRLAV